MDTKPIALQTPTSRLVFYPQYGLQWRELVFQQGNLEIPVVYGWSPGKEFFSCGNFLMFPWVNRLVHPPWNSTHFQYDSQHTPLHGTAYNLVWSCSEFQSNEVVCKTQWEGTFQTQSEWTTCQVGCEVKFQLLNHSLLVDLTLENRTECIFPYAVGWHPYFSFPENSQAILELPQCEELAIDPHSLLPYPDSEGRIQRATPKEDKTLSLIAQSYDNLFYQEAGCEAMVRFLDLGYGYKIESHSTSTKDFFPYLQIYKPKSSDFVAIEPMSSPGNFLHYPKEKVELLHPGDRKKFFFQISFFSF